jgi:dynactin complex subunit
MSKLSSLMDQLSEHIAEEPELRDDLNTARQELKRQQRRYANFLRLTREYAVRYFLDATEEVSFLDAQEKRLAMARDLHNQAVDLRKSYENGTLDRMKNIRRTGT